MKKKIIFGVCMLGLVAMMATSCKKNEETTQSFPFQEDPMEMDDMNNDGKTINDVSFASDIEGRDAIKKAFEDYCAKAESLYGKPIAYGWSA